MKVLFVGNSDFAADGISQRLAKEGNKIYVLETAEKPVKSENRKYKYYYAHKSSEIRTVFKSSVPEIVIFAGDGYNAFKWNDKQYGNMEYLMSCLECSVDVGVKQFILLSSTEVYGNVKVLTNEDTAVAPVTVKGIISAQEEKLLETYRARGLFVAYVLRCDVLFGKEIVWDEAWNDMAEEESHKLVQPLYADDLADAVHRVITGAKDPVYNVASHKAYTMGQVTALLQDNTAEIQPADAVIDCAKIKKSLEWTDMADFEQLIRSKAVTVSSPVETDPKKKKSSKGEGTHKVGTVVRRVLDNAVAAAFFIMLQVLLQNNSLFSQIDFLLIYVVVISLFWGFKQGTLAIVIACVAYLSIKGDDLFNMVNFYVYIENLIKLVQYVFFGVITGYTVDTLRANLEDKTEEMDTLQQSYDDLKEINSRTVEIKDEYEKRILTMDEGLPHLYSVTKSINVLDPDRIFWEVLKVLQEMLNTNTAAVYRYQAGKPFLRLLTSLNPESVMGGRSWNISESPEIVNAVSRGNIYEGNVWENEPAVILPIGSDGENKVVAVIKELPFESMSLYTMNQLKTLSLLIGGSVDRAMEYENATHDRRYIADTDVMKSEEFQKEIELEQEKKEDAISDFSVIEIQNVNGLAAAYNSVANLFRENDVFGTNEEQNKLYVLLKNTAAADLEAVIKRLGLNQIEAAAVQ